MALAAIAFALLTCSDTIFKLLASGGHPAYQILLINGCFALLPILLWTRLTGGFGRLSTTRLPQHLARGATSVVAAFASIFAYSRLPLTDFYAIVFAGPLVVSIMGAFWLGEKIDAARWVAIIIGFLGILVVVNPLASPILNSRHHVMTAHEGAAMFGRMAAFGSVFCYALSVTMVRRMRVNESNMSFSFYGFLASLSICACLCIILGTPDISWSDVGHLALTGVLTGIASICMMTAYHRTPVALVAPFQYTQIIWGAIAGFVIWQHVPSHHLMAGAAIVAGSGLYIIHLEMKAKEKNGRLFS